MIDIEDFRQFIAPKAPGAPIPSVNLAIRQAAIAICERGRQWRFTDTIPVLDLDDIDFAPPDGSVVMDYESILFNDVALEPKTAVWMDKCMRGWRRGTITGYPRFYSQMSMGTLRIAPIENGLLTVACTLKPTMDADQLPAFLMQQHAELLTWGALGRLLSTPDQPFTDFNTGAAYLGAFEQKLQSLAFKGSSGQQRARPRVRGNY